MATRREFLKKSAWAAAAAIGTFKTAPVAAAQTSPPMAGSPKKRPNVVFVFPDQMRAQAAGYAGDPNVHSPQLDKLASQSLNFSHAVSCCPVCSPARGSLLTGQYANTHGVVINDAKLQNHGTSLGEAFKGQGYDTAYIGKWHLSGPNRAAFIPPSEHRGFDFWHVRECCHNYWNDFYFGDTPQPIPWNGYDARAQTNEACDYLRSRASVDKPFLLVVSWGPPHGPYQTAPPEDKSLYPPPQLALRKNVPLQDDVSPEIQSFLGKDKPKTAAQAREWLSGYYGHITALDGCVGQLLDTLDQTGMAEDTIFVFWSDHGDMLGSQAQGEKQRPWDESIRVPLLVRYPREFGTQGRVIDTVINAPDLMPTLLGLCGITPPASVQGNDYAPFLRGQAPAPADAALIACYVPFGGYTRAVGGREFRGVRTSRYTYVHTLEGPWLLYDNQEDPFQMSNLVTDAAHAGLRADLEKQMRSLLARYDDAFESAEAIIQRWGYPVRANLTMPYTN